MSNNKLIALLMCLFALVVVVNSSALARSERGLLEDADKVIKQSGNVDMNNVGQLADIVAKNGADDCLARVICELTQNPKLHGESGNKFAQSLLKFRQNKHPKIKKYHDAMTHGARAKNSEQCKSHYSQCTYTTQEVIQVGNKVLKT